MTLQPIFFLRFIYTIMMLGISFSIGIKIASKYFEHKNIVFLLVGITAIIVSEPWWVTPIDAMLLFLGYSPVPENISQVIGAVGLPIGIFTWLYAITELMYKNKQKIILLVAAVYCVLFEVVFIYLLFTYHNLRENLLPLLIIGGYIASFLVLILVTGFLFTREGLKADDPTLRLKAKFLRVAFIFYFFAGIGVMAQIFAFIVSIFLIISAFTFYFGFILPEKVKNIFIK